VFEIAEAEAAIFFATVMPCRPSSPISGQSSRGNLLVRVDLGGQRRDAVGGEFARGVADGVGGFAELEIELVGHQSRGGSIGRPKRQRPAGSRRSVDGN
jgi:hypothetical protein